MECSETYFDSTAHTFDREEYTTSQLHHFTDRKIVQTDYQDCFNNESDCTKFSLTKNNTFLDTDSE